MAELRPSLFESDLIVRDMETADLKEVLAIERNAQISPWSRLSFEESLNRKNVCRLVEAQGAILGFHISSAVLDELHILNVVVAKSVQGIGIGHKLMQDILEQAQQLHAQKIFLEVRESNIVAQNLYDKWQFRKLAVRKNYYQPAGDMAGRENALVYVRDEF